MELKKSQRSPAGEYPVGRSWMWGRMDTINNAGRVLVEAEEALWEAVRQARATGMTWEEVGCALNCTKQAAFARFSKPPRGRLV
jgi:hypothetical protein